MVLCPRDVAPQSGGWMCWFSAELMMGHPLVLAQTVNSLFHRQFLVETNKYSEHPCALLVPATCDGCWPNNKKNILVQRIDAAKQYVHII